MHGQLIVRPEIVPAALYALEVERASYATEDESSVNSSTAPAYTEAIQLLINAVNEGRAIDLSAHMTLEEQLDALEFGGNYGTVARYLMGMVRDTFDAGNRDAATAADWRYLSSIAALGADIESVGLAA